MHNVHFGSLIAYTIGCEPGANYPNWVMGPFDLSNEMVLTTTYKKLAQENKLNHRIKINDYSLLFVPF